MSSIAAAISPSLLPHDDRPCHAYDAVLVHAPEQRSPLVMPRAVDGARFADDKRVTSAVLEVNGARGGEVVRHGLQEHKSGKGAVDETFWWHV